MVVLDQNGVEEADPVIGDAPGRRRGLFERAETRRSLARVEDAAAGACDRFGILPGEGGDATEALQEIESDALVFEQRTGRTRDPGNDLIVLAAIAVALVQGDGIVELGEQVETGDDERLAGQEPAARLLRFRHAGARRNVACPDIFFERHAHDGRHKSLSRCA